MCPGCLRVQWYWAIFLQIRFDKNQFLSERAFARSRLLWGRLCSMIFGWEWALDAFLGLDQSFILVLTGASQPYYRLRNHMEGKSASCCEFARAAIFAAPCDTCCIANTFSVTFQLHCWQLVANTFCDFAFVSLVCVAQMCRGARWWPRATRNGPNRTELCVVADALSHKPSWRWKRAFQLVRHAKRASQLCPSQFASMMCACYMHMHVRMLQHAWHACSCRFRSINDTFCMYHVYVTCGALYSTAWTADDVMEHEHGDVCTKFDSIQTQRTVTLSILVSKSICWMPNVNEVYTIMHALFLTPKVTVYYVIRVKHVGVL